MSQENVERLRAAYADPRGMIAAAAGQVAADAVFDFSRAYPDQPVFQGVENLARFRAEGPWGELQFEPERFIDVDDERVLVLVRVTAVGESSGVRGVAEGAHEFTIRDGLVVYFRAYGDRAEALAAAGLAE